MDVYAMATGTLRIRVGCVLVLLVAMAATLLPPSRAEASLDVAELYLRKIREGERTFFDDGGWQRRRNRIEFFYEADYILGAGTGDPRFVSATDQDGDPLGSYSLGTLVLLSPERSVHHLTLYTLHSKTFELDTEPFAFAPLVAPIVPGAFSKDEGVSLYQGVTGLQLRLGDWIEGGYGVLLDERRNALLHRSFYEFNLPFLYLRSNAVVSPDGDHVERSQTSFVWDEASWVQTIEVGQLVLDVNEERRFYHAGFDRLANFLSANIHVNSDFDFAHGAFGIHLATYKHGDVRHGGKFGGAVDFQLMATAVNPRAANLWSDDFGGDETEWGVTAEIYIQQPAMTWLGILQMLLTAQAAAFEQNAYRRQQLIDDGARSASAAFDSAEEDDALYGGLTLGFAYNSPRTLRQVAGALNHSHIYLHYRLFY